VLQSHVNASTIYQACLMYTPCDAGASPTKHKRGGQLGTLAHILRYFEFQFDQCINDISDITFEL
jgi:hypothetical protein